MKLEQRSWMLNELVCERVSQAMEVEQRSWMLNE